MKYTERIETVYNVPADCRAVDGAQVESTLEHEKADNRDCSVSIITILCLYEGNDRGAQKTTTYSRQGKAKCGTEDQGKKTDPANSEPEIVRDLIPRFLDKWDPDSFYRFGDDRVRNESEGDNTWRKKIFNKDSLVGPRNALTARRAMQRLSVATCGLLH